MFHQFHLHLSRYAHSQCVCIHTVKQAWQLCRLHPFWISMSYMTEKKTKYFYAKQGEIIPYLQSQGVFQLKQLHILCSSRKYPYSLHRRDWNFLGVEGSVRPKTLKKCMKLNWNFQRGGEVLAKLPSVGEIWIFSKITHCKEKDNVSKQLHCKLHAGLFESNFHLMTQKNCYQVNQIDFMFPCVCWVIDHRCLLWSIIEQTHSNMESVLYKTKTK